MHSVGHAVTTVMTLIMGLAFIVISKHITTHQIAFIVQLKTSFVLHLHAVMRFLRKNKYIFKMLLMKKKESFFVSKVSVGT